jgi:hypothetical protein
MHGDFSPEAQAAAERKAHAATVFAAHAPVITAAADLVAEGHVVVAVVSSEQEFAGTTHVELAAVVDIVPTLEGDGGCAMVFAPGTSEDEVRRRADEMASIARSRAEIIARIAARRGAVDQD